MVDTDIEDFNDDDIQGDGPGVELPDAIFAIFEALTPTINDPHVSHDPQSTNFAIGYASSGVNMCPVTVNIGADELQPPAPTAGGLLPLQVTNSDSGLVHHRRPGDRPVRGSAEPDHRPLRRGRRLGRGYRPDRVRDPRRSGDGRHLSRPMDLARSRTEAPGQGQPSYDEALTFASGRVSLRAEVADFDGDIDLRQHRPREQGVLRGRRAEFVQHHR